MSVRSALTTGPVARDTHEQRGGPVNRPLDLFADATVDAAVEIALHSSRTPDDEAVSISFGQERLRLEFYDVESLERLRDVADEGARRLRAVIEANARADAAEQAADAAGPVAAAADRPVELVGGGVPRAGQVSA